MRRFDVALFFYLKMKHFVLTRAQRNSTFCFVTHTRGNQPGGHQRANRAPARRRCSKGHAMDDEVFAILKGQLAVLAIALMLAATVGAVLTI